MLCRCKSNAHSQTDVNKQIAATSGDDSSSRRREQNCDLKANVSVRLELNTDSIKVITTHKDENHVRGPNHYVGSKYGGFRGWSWFEEEMYSSLSSCGAPCCSCSKRRHYQAVAV